jgi:hypothetical protein
MPTIKASKRVNREQLYDEIVAANPSLAPRPIAGGHPMAQVVIEQGEDGELLVHILNDDADETVMASVDTAVKDHKRKPEKVVDPVADARKLVKRKADQGDELAKAVLTLLGEPPA